MKDVAAVVAFDVAEHFVEMFLLLLVLLSVEVIEDCADTVDCAVAVVFCFHLCLVVVHREAPWPPVATLCGRW